MEFINQTFPLQKNPLIDFFSFSLICLNNNLIHLEDKLY